MGSMTAQMVGMKKVPLDADIGKVWYKTKITKISIYLKTLSIFCCKS